MENLVREPLNKSNESIQALKAKVQSTENTLGKMTHDVGEKLGSMASDISHTATDYVKTSSEYVKENPAKSVAIAAATGVALGSLLTMAMRKRH